MKRAVWGFGVAAILILAFFWFFKSRQVDQAGHQRFEGNLRQLKEIDALFREQVLEAKFNMVNDYDAFSTYQQTLEKALRELENIPNFVQPGERLAIVDLLHDYQALAETRAEKFEEFKSQNAVLKNSLKYFPVAGEEFLASLHRQGGCNELEAAFDGLLRQVMRYAADSEEGSNHLDDSMEQVNRHRMDYTNQIVAASLTSLLLHARTIQGRMPVVDQLTRELVSLPTSEKIDGIFHIYETNLARALDRAGFYSAFFYVFLFTFVAGIASALVALRASNRNLEHRVQERTNALHQSNENLRREMAERQRAQSQLLEISHKAGMAEVATGVLHNLGNVLNSVNISTAILHEKVMQSKAVGIQNIADALDKRMEFGGFFTENPSGKKLADYLRAMAKLIVKERQDMAGEIRSQQKHIDHIKEIVAMHQSVAKVSGITETFNVPDLVEEALALNATGLARHKFEIVREFSDGPPIHIEKHKVLQILLNLIINAKQACARGETSDKKLTLRVMHTEDRVRISVSDNGSGIAPEHLPRIFSHGFTTRKDGHGFGLHSSALAAKDLAGNLFVHSDGPGLGATFTLEIPTDSKAQNGQDSELTSCSTSLVAV